MSLLDHPDAPALWDDASVSPHSVRDCTDRVTGFLRRYLPRFYRAERRENAPLLIRGLLSSLERKTGEPIAIAAGLCRKPIQFFVGSGQWDDEAVRAERRQHVRDEFGRPAASRAVLQLWKECYVLDMPCNTTVRDLERRRPPRKKAGVGRKREGAFVRADTWAACQPEPRWERITVRDGAKGPRVVAAMTVRVRAKPDGRIGPEQRQVVIRPVGEPRVVDARTNAGPEVPLPELVRVQRQRHRIEEVFEVGNGEAGLDHHEVRSWVSWHHHMTLSLVALWFLCWERRRFGGENPGGPCAPDAASLHAIAPEPGTDPRGDRPGSRSCVAA